LAREAKKSRTGEGDQEEKEWNPGGEEKFGKTAGTSPFLTAHKECFKQMGAQEASLAAVGKKKSQRERSGGGKSN